jgi:DNA-binding transcriptional ArsR family regulator
MLESRGRDSKKRARLAQALSHDLRLRILRISVERAGPISPREAAKELSTGLSNIAYHFHVLVDLEALRREEGGSAIASAQDVYSPEPAVVAMPMVKELLAAGTEAST